MKRLLAALFAACSLVAAAAAQDLDLPPLDDLPPPDAPVEQAPLDPVQGDPAQGDPEAPLDPADPSAPAENIAPTPQPVAPAPKAARIQNKVAEFSGIDKITGKITTFDVYINETVQFGALQVTPRICYTSPATEAPQTDSFVEVDEITLDREIRRIFTGWMFSDSPGLNAVEHPVYDVWLKGCKTDSTVPPPAG